MIPATFSSQALLEAGDTFYLPKGVVHYAEGTGEPSIHATIGIRRAGATWFDVVYDEIVQKYEHAESNRIIHPDVIEDMVQSTQLGVRLAQLVPLGAVRQLFPTPTSDPLLVEQLLLYTGELVDAVLFRAKSLPSVPQLNPTIYGRGHMHDRPLQHLVDVSFCPAADVDTAEPVAIVASEQSVAARIARLQAHDQQQNFLDLARGARQVKWHDATVHSAATSIVLV